jgi:nucleoside 2-deoxyribosyltransferase
MKIYLAARYSRFAELQGYRAQLEQLSAHRVTSRWIDGSHQLDEEGLSSPARAEERMRFAREDWNDLRTSDCVVCFTEKPRTSNSRGGRHVELGLALAWQKRTLVVGWRENVFCCLPQVEFFETWEAARAALTRKGR